MAATTIQAGFRGKVGRRKARVWKIYVGKQTYLGIHCQRIVRGFLGRIFFYYEKRRIRLLRANAATRLQALWQGRIGRAKARTEALRLLKHQSATLIQTMIQGFLGRIHFRQQLVKIKGDLMATTIQSIARMYITIMRLPMYVDDKKRYCAQRPISRGFRRYRGQKQSRVRQMMVDSGHCAIDPTQKAFCYFEYTGQFLCEKSLNQAIELLEKRGEHWKFAEEVKKTPDIPDRKLFALLGPGI